MRIRTPQFLWHGGGMTNGKPDPVFSLDIHPTNVLATAGIDGSTPPRGSVHLWKIDPNGETQEFLVDLCDHQSTVHAVRFSPCGTMLASASDRLVTVYKATSASAWATIDDSKQLQRVWMHSNLGEIYDLQWSPESDFLIAGSIDTKGEILRIDSRDTLVLAGHGNYVQGVCWDPLNEYVGTQSADRSVKLYRIKQPKPQKDKEVAPSMVKLSTKGQVVIKMIPLSGPGDAVGAASTDIDAMDVMPDGPPVPAKGQNLFASATESCFFRRPAFSPDGALLVTPMGLFKTSAANPLVAGIDPPSPSYCTHVFSRASFFQPNAISGNTVMPIYSLTGKEEPSVAVRFNPRLFTNMVSPAADAEDSSVLRGKYRMVFAAVTTSSVFIYDTQHHYPIVTVSGIHYATINDATWSADGSLLIVCSSDGYVTFIKFPSGELGDLLPDDQVPTCVKASHPCIYKYTKPTAQVAVASITDSTTAVTTAVDAAGTTDLAPSIGGSIPSGVEPMETEGETKSVMNTVAELAVTTAKVVPDSSLSTNVFNMDKDTAVQSSSPLVGNSTE